MRRLLVTGGAGFIGSNFVHYWLSTHPGDRLVVLDALTAAGNRNNLPAAEGHPEFRFVHGDIRDGDLVESLLLEERLDTIVHFAAESHVDRSIAGPDVFIETNVMGTHELLKAARKVWIEEGRVENHHFHHVSTDEVFGSLEPGAAAFTEFARYAPNSPYSASKAASDHLVRAYYRTFGLRVTTSHCSNNYGPRQLPEKLIPLVIVNVLRGLPVPVYGDGRNVRDWLHVADHCAGVDLVLARGAIGEVYNIGGGCEVENLVLARRLCELMDAAFAGNRELAARFPEAPPAQGRESASLVTMVTDRAGHDRRYAIDCAKARRDLGYEARHSLSRGLAETVDWYLENESWWRDFLASRHADKAR